MGNSQVSGYDDITYLKEYITRENMSINPVGHNGAYRVDYAAQVVSKYGTTIVPNISCSFSGTIELSTLFIKCRTLFLAKNNLSALLIRK